MQAEISAPATTIYHFTQWKAGSQWVQGVLTELEPQRVLVPSPEFSNGTVFSGIEQGRIYTPLYIHRLRFDESPLATVKHRKFVVVRDLRDTLVSWYFSLIKTHEANELVQTHREKLQSMDPESGLLYLLGHKDFFGLAMVGSTWAQAADTLVVRFESLIKDPSRWFGMICRECGIEASPARLQAALEQRSFDNLSKPASGGDGSASHYRKGVAGDWRAHFTPTIANEFAGRYDDLMIRTGYAPTLL
jgi:lipopolysaccharide transport system ATP-binding protein